MRILDGANLIQIDAWDPETGEPKSYTQMIRGGGIPSEGQVPSTTVAQEDPPPEDRGADEKQ